MNGLAIAAAVALAGGTASASNHVVTYQGAGGDEAVTVGFDGGNAFVRSALGVTGSGACLSVDPTNVDCGPGVTAFAVTFLAGRDSLQTENIGSATITAHGGAGADDLIGSPGNDVITGDEDGDSQLAGLDGNDIIDGGPGDDYLYDGPGNDSVTGGPGNDVVYGDPDDATEGCEVAPDPDGDGYLAPQDCAPNDRAIHPGAGEIVGNPVDEDCDGVVGYYRVNALVSYRLRHKGARTGFAKLMVTGLQKGDRVQIRCNRRNKGCPFIRKTVTIKQGRTLNVARLLKKRYFKRGAVIEVRMLRADQIGKVVRLTVIKRDAKAKTLCLPVGKTTPTRCS